MGNQVESTQGRERDQIIHQEVGRILTLVKGTLESTLPLEILTLDSSF
jgi:hypothetical protein